jgi:hypothetical protein
MVYDLIVFLNLFRCLKIDRSTKKVGKRKIKRNVDVQQMQSHEYDP